VIKNILKLIAINPHNLSFVNIYCDN